MPVNANAGETYDNDLINEQLHQVAYSISPYDTPFMSNIGQGSVENTLFEWPVYELAAVDNANRVIEGESAPSVNSNTLAGRAQNYTQISDKVIEITDTAQKVDDAGKLQKMAKQMTIQTRALKRDMEAMLLDNVAAATGSSGTARATAGLIAWIKTNTSADGGGGDPTVSGSGDFDGYPDAAASEGSTRALTEALVRTVMQSCYTEGGEPSVLMVNPV